MSYDPMKSPHRRCRSALVPLGPPHERGGVSLVRSAIIGRSFIAEQPVEQRADAGSAGGAVFEAILRNFRGAGECSHRTCSGHDGASAHWLSTPVCWPHHPRIVEEAAVETDSDGRRRCDDDPFDADEPS
jgi:hypothetical protein